MRARMSPPVGPGPSSADAAAAAEMMDAAADNTDTSGEQYSDYGVIMFIAVLVIILIVTLVSFICTRIHLSGRARPPSRATSFRFPTTTAHHGPCTTIGPGLDEATLNSYPMVLYSQANKGLHGRGGGCSICLGEYKESDVLRLLPDCGHSFHQKCVDAWLRLNPTCPICRHSPLPSPLPTPLAEVTPLATSR